MVISKVTSTRKLCLPPFTQEYIPVLPVMQCLKTVSYILSSFLFFFFNCIWRANLAPVFGYSNKVTDHLCPCQSTLVCFHWVCFSTFKISSFYFIPKCFHYWHSGKQLDWLGMMPYEVQSLRKENILSLTRTLVGESKPFGPEVTSDCQNLLDQV